jgi:hypothetical protein
MTVECMQPFGCAAAATAATKGISSNKGRRVSRGSREPIRILQALTGARERRPGRTRHVRSEEGDGPAEEESQGQKKGAERKDETEEEETHSPERLVIFGPRFVAAIDHVFWSNNGNCRTLSCCILA